MRNLLHKGKSVASWVLPPQSMLLGLLIVLWYGGNAVLIVYIAYKIAHAVTVNFF